MVVYLVIIAPYAILWTRWVAVSSFYSQSHMLDRCRSLKSQGQICVNVAEKRRFLNNKFIHNRSSYYIYFIFFFRFYKYHLCTNVECSFSVLRL